MKPALYSVLSYLYTTRANYEVHKPLLINTGNDYSRCLMKLYEKVIKERNISFKYDITIHDEYGYPYERFNCQEWINLKYKKVSMFKHLKMVTDAK